MVSAAPHTSTVTVKAAIYRSDLGRSKKTNEDGVLAMSKVPLWAVADGTGGVEPARIALMTLKEHAGQLAAKNLDVAASPSSASRLAVGRHLEAMFAKANIAVSEASETLPDRRIATTLCAATIVGQHAFIAHVGDSRAYLFRGGSLRCLTNDHTLAALQLRRGDITASEFATSPFQRTLSQAIGMSPALEVDLLELRLHPGDKLIVTSNGLNRALPDDTICRCLLADGDAEDRADLLIQKVNERGAPDNTTFILIEMDGPVQPRRDAPNSRTSDRPITDGTDQSRTRAVDLEHNVRNCFLFQGLSDTEWLQIQPYLEVLETAPRRAPLCQIGQNALGFCVLASGRIQVDLPGGETRITGPGEHFGTLALATEGPAQETAVVLEPSLVYVLSKARFAEILRLNPTLGGRLTLSLLESLGNRLGILTARIGQVLDAANGRG